MSGNDSARCDGARSRDHGSGNDDHTRGLPSLSLGGLSLGRESEKRDPLEEDRQRKSRGGHVPLTCRVVCWEPGREAGGRSVSTVFPLPAEDAPAAQVPHQLLALTGLL